MKKNSTMFLQTVIVFMGMATVAVMIRFPLTEGRAANLDLFSIYADPLIIYGYVASLPFFIALYQAFKLLGYIGQDKAFSLSSVTILRCIRYCAVTLSILIATAGLYIRIFHDKEDDAAGFLAVCIATIFISITVAMGAMVFEKVFQKGLDMEANKQL